MNDRVFNEGSIQAEAYRIGRKRLHSLFKGIDNKGTAVPQKKTPRTPSAEDSNFLRIREENKLRKVTFLTLAEMETDPVKKRALLRKAYKIED